MPTIPNRATTKALVGGVSAVALAASAALERVAPLPLDITSLAWTLGLAALFVALEHFALDLSWRSLRLSASVSEAGLVLGLVVASPLATVLAYVAARLAISIMERNPPIKLAFNVAQAGLGGAIAGLVFVGAGAVAPPLVAAIFAALAFNLVLDATVAFLFAGFERSPPWRIYRERLALPSIVSLTLGVALGACGVALWLVHPLAAVALAPLFVLVAHHSRLQQRSDRELAVHRRLEADAHALIGCDDRDAIAQRVLETCVDVVRPARARIEFSAGVLLLHDIAPAAPDAHAIEAPIVGRDGKALGSIAVWARAGKRRYSQEDAALVSMLAAEAARALENASALDEVRHQRDLLARKDKLSTLGTLIAGVAHEINNPLTYMMGNLELMRDDVGRLEAALRESGAATSFEFGEMTRMLDSSLSGAERIAYIVRSLRSVARPGSPGHTEQVPLNPLVESIATLVRTSVADDVVLECRLDPSDPRVRGNSPELHQVVLNLAKNAIEALEGRPGRVVLGVAQKNGTVELKVEDDGPGMSEEVRKRLFQPFYTTKGAGGMGLGLSIVDGIVRDHGGEIRVDSQPGRGTTFTLRLPAVVKTETAGMVRK